MAIATKSGGAQGKWIDKKELKTGDVAKIKTEATEQVSQQGWMQWVAKIHVKGQTEPGNLAINKPSKNALIDAFGEDTNKWIDKLLTLHTEKTTVSGKRGIAIYLVPEGFEVKEDEEGYVVVAEKGKSLARDNRPDVVGGEDEIDPDLIPF